MQWFSHLRENSKPSYFGTRTGGEPKSRRLRGECGMGSRNLSRYILISRHDSLFEATGTIPNTHNISNERQHRSQVAEDNRGHTGIRHFQA